MSLNIIPLVGQNLANTRDNIRNNFTFIDNGFAVNHVELNSGADSGKHKFVTMPEQGSSPATLVNEMAMFTRQSPDSSQTEACIRRESNGTVYEFTIATRAQNGWTRLPSGIIMLWGFRNANLNAGANLQLLNSANFANFPGFSDVYNVQITPVSTNTTIVVQNSASNAGSITLYSNTNGASAFYTVIGV